jgi:hypothetical protein
MSYRYGITSPMALSMMVFAVIYFLDVAVGLIPDIRGVEHLLTYVSALLVVITIMKEAVQ